MKINKKRFLVSNVLTLTMIFLLLQSQTASSQELVFTETFDSGSNWELNTYYNEWSDEWDSFRWFETTNDVAKIDDGTLHFTDDKPENASYFDIKIGQAVTTTSILYGIWSYDFDASNEYCDFAFYFAYNFFNEIDGTTEAEFIATGYALFISTSDGVTERRTRSLNIMKFEGEQNGITRSAVVHLDDDITGVNHVDITRYENNTIIVDLNEETVLSYHDTDVVAESSDEISIIN